MAGSGLGSGSISPPVNRGKADMAPHDAMKVRIYYPRETKRYINQILPHCGLLPGAPLMYKLQPIESREKPQQCKTVSP